MAKSGALIFAILFLFNGCASTKVHFIGEERYKPSRAVEILKSRPDRAYLEIALIEAKAPKYADGNFVFEKMRSKAQKIGANALIPFDYDEIPELIPSRESRITVGTRKPGTVDILSQNLSRQPKVWEKALAIRYVEY